MDSDKTIELDNGNKIIVLPSKESKRSFRGQRYKIALDDSWHTDDEKDIFAEKLQDVVDNFADLEN